MAWLKFFTSSVGRKLLMSATGLAMCVFLLAHMAGNLLLLSGYATYNAYSEALVSRKLFLYSAEFGLIFIFVLHIYLAIRLTRDNQKARPIPYEVFSSSGRSRRSWASFNMGVTGTFILLFVIYHLIHMKWGTFYITASPEGEPTRDLARLVVEEFKKPTQAALYVIAMGIIALHLVHGFRSAFETLGLAKSRWDRGFLWASRIFVVGVMGGFVLIPLAIFFGLGGLS